MPTKLTPTIYGEKKDITPDKYNIGSLMKAITFDLKEFGTRGVQGLLVKETDARNLVAYEAKRMKKPIIRAGVVKKDLVMVINDKDDDKLEGMAVLVKNYVDIKAELEASTAAVVHVQPNDANQAVRRSATALADRLGTKVQEEADAEFGDVTGDVMLCAHGDPKITAGRVVGVSLGEKSPEQIVALLTKNTDKSKNLAKGYRGKITLTGCFTGSGGPEAHEADHPFAQKVKALLDKAGYKSAVVSAFPGPVAVARSDGVKDGLGSPVTKGREQTWHDRYSEDGIMAMRKKIDALTADVVARGKKHEGGLRPYLASTEGKARLKAIQGIEKEILEARKEIEDAGDEDGYSRAYLRGDFGLRVIQSEVGAKS
jgi:hypothetical protein